MSTTPVHIVCLVSNDLTFDQRMHKTAATLVSAGYRVTLVGRKLPHSRPLASFSYRQVRLSCWVNQGKLFYFILQWRLFWWLLSHPFDVVCAVDLDTILPAVGVARLRNKKLVYDAHEYFTEVPEVINRPLVQRVWKWIERVAMPNTDARYTVSGSLVQRFEQEYHLPFKLVRNMPHYQPADRPQSGDHPPFLLYQGALNEGRGLEQLLLAMYEIDIPLYLVGEGDLSEKLRSLVITMGLQQKVIFKGYVAPGALQQLTQQATLGINLLENKGLSYFYSLSNKFFDYVQAGVPQICIRFPEYEKLNAIHEVALMVDDLKAFTIYASINKLLDDKALYKKLQSNCRIAAKEWTWEHEVPTLLSVYQSIAPTQ